MRPRGSGGSSSSRTPAYTVGRDSPVRRAIRAPPPRPSALAPAPASRRRCFSVRYGATSTYSPASTASTSTPRRHRLGLPPQQLSDKLVTRGPLNAEVVAFLNDKVRAKALLDTHRLDTPEMAAIDARYAELENNKLALERAAFNPPQGVPRLPL